MEILAQLHRIAVKPSIMPADVSAMCATRQLRLVADDKRELDQMISTEQLRGWILVSRSYSLDDGHGALLFWNDKSKAA